MSSKVLCEICEKEYAKSYIKKHKCIPVKKEEVKEEIIQEIIVEDLPIIQEVVQEIKGEIIAEDIQQVSFEINSDNNEEIQHDLSEQKEEDLLEEISFTLSNDYSTNTCQICQHELVCVQCEQSRKKEKVQANLMHHKSQEIVKIIPDIIDIDYNLKKQQVYIQTQNKGYTLQESCVFVKDYEYVRKDNHDYFPIVKAVDYKITSLDKYRQNQCNYSELYGHANTQKQLLRKIIHDNNFNILPLKQYVIAYVDIETYNETEYNKIPLVSNSRSHIAMISMVLQFIVENNSIVKQHVIINNEKKYMMTQVNKDIEIHLCEDEQQSCIFLLDYLASLQCHVIVGTFNGSVNEYSQDFSYGYDMQFIVERSRLNLHPQLKSLKLVQDDDENGQKINKFIGKSLTKIQELPMLHFVDYKYKLYAQASPDQKNQLQDQSLDSWLTLLKIGNKLEHNYYELQMRLSDEYSEISDIVNYCVYDSYSLYLIEKEKGIIGTIIGLQNELQIPLSFAIHNTNVQNLEVYLQRSYINSGYIVQYYPKYQEEQQKYKGAYTETVAIPNKIYKNCMCLDFASLYPNSMISCNLDLTTYLKEKQSGCITVDVSDDDNIQENEYYFSNDKVGIIPQLLMDLFAKRKEAKNMMKLDKQNYKKYDNQQYVIKILINSLYGLFASQISPLFFMPLAISTTSYGRKSTITARDIIISRGHEFLASDTDSIFFNLHKDIQVYEQLQNEMNQINTLVQQKMNSSRLVLEYEEIFISLAFIDGRKSYMGLLLEQNMEQWTNTSEISYDLCKLKLRGISWSKMSEYMRQLLTKHLKEYLMSSYDSEEYYKKMHDLYLHNIREAVNNKDKNELEKYAEKIKMSSDKARDVKELKMKYSAFIQKQSHIDVVVLQGTTKISDRKIPICALNQHMYSRIDINWLLDRCMTSYKKFFLQKDKRISKFKEQLNQLQNEYTSEDILVRVEQLKHGKVQYSTEKIHASQLYSYMKNYPSKSFHEIIGEDKIRLTFDIDGNEYTLIGDICIELDKIVKKMVGYLPQKQILSSSGNKKSYHIYYAIAMSLDYCRKIAQEAHKIIPEIDTQIYNINKSIRLPNTGKIDSVKKQLIHRYFYCDQKNMENCLMTYTENIPYKHMPLHLQNTHAIDSYYTHKIITNKHKNTYKNIGDIIGKYLYEQNMDMEIIQATETLYNLQPKQQYMCPIHKRIHEHDRMFVQILHNQYVKLYCYRSEKDNRKNENIILKSPEINEEEKVQDLDVLLQNLNNQINMLQNSCIQSSKYLDLQLDEQLRDNHTIFIRSQLGTGKSYIIEHFLKQLPADKKIIILSHRISFSLDISKRYNTVSYQDINGQINMNKYPKITVQVESLHRVENSHGSIIILDEIESLINQLGNNIARKQQANQYLINMLNTCDKLICMDGFLQQQTVDMIKSIIGNKQTITIQNTHKPYENNLVNIVKYNAKKQDDIKKIINTINVELSQKKKVVSFCTSNSLLMQIYEQFKENYNVKVYHGKDYMLDENNKNHYQVKQEELQDVSTHWKCDLLLYTSTITAGVNFDQDYFHKFIHIYCNNTTDAQSFIQGCVRVRQFQEKEHTIFYAHEYNEEQLCTIPYNQILQEDIEIFQNQQAQQLDIYVRTRQNAIKQFRNSIFINSLYELGFTCNIIDEKEEKEKKKKQKENEDMPDKYEKFILCNVSPSNVELYDNIQANKSILFEAQLPDNFQLIVEKIVKCRMANLNPINCKKENQNDWINQFKEYKRCLIYNQTKKLLRENMQMIDKLIECDRQRQINCNIQHKDINRITLKQNRQLILQGMEIQKHIQQEDNMMYLCSQKMKEIKMTGKKLKNSLGAIGYIITEKQQQKVVNGNRLYKIILKKIVEQADKQ